MKKRFIFPLEPMSINRVHCRDQRYLTSHFQNWAAKISHYLGEDENQKKIIQLKNHFNPSQHAYKVEITAHYPREMFYTQKDQISAKTHDISNTEKPLIDVLFLAKYPNSLKMDDKHIISLISKKKAADDYLIEVNIEICPLEDSEDANVESACE